MTLGYSQTGTISGHVYNRANGAGLVGATVLISGTTSGTMVDFDGSYEIKQIPPGTYNLTAHYLSKGDSTVNQLLISAVDELVFNFVLPRYSRLM